MSAAPTCLHLSALGGIICVTFAVGLSGNQSIVLLRTCQSAENIDDLERVLQNLGDTWGIRTETEITSRSSRTSVAQSSRNPPS